MRHNIELLTICTFAPTETKDFQVWIQSKKDILEKHLTFDDKDSYLQWVENWKDLYKELSIAIRTLKLARKLPHNRPIKLEDNYISEIRSTYTAKRTFSDGSVYHIEPNVGQGSNLSRYATALIYLRKMGRSKSVTLKTQSINQL